MAFLRGVESQFCTSLVVQQSTCSTPLCPQAIGSYGAGLIDIEELQAVECHALPGSGACGGMFTANTMASSVEALGMALPGEATPLLGSHAHSQAMSPPLLEACFPAPLVSAPRHCICPCRYP